MAAAEPVAQVREWAALVEQAAQVPETATPVERAARPAASARQPVRTAEQVQAPSAQRRTRARARGTQEWQCAFESRHECGFRPSPRVTNPTHVPARPSARMLNTLRLWQESFG
jgi:hypothetical protein